MRFIDLNRQYRAYKEEIDRAVAEVLASGQFILGSKVEELEQELARFVGRSHAIGVSSGTDGLLLALMALGVEPGDLVITTPFTFIATAEVIALLRARPLFVDIEPETCNISVQAAAEALELLRRQGRRAKGMVAVSLYGQCPDMDGLQDLAREHGLFLVEDGCQSFGALYKGRPSCGLGDVGVTSFFPSKPLGCYGDGGMIFVDDDGLARTLRMLRVHGQDRRYHHALLGINGRLDALQAAILLVKFRHFQDEVARRQEAAARYQRLLEDLAPQVRPVAVKEDRISVFAQYTVRVEAGRRDQIRRVLADQGIPTAVHYPVPLHRQPVFADAEHFGLPEAERAAAEVLSLPMHPFLEEEEQARVVEALAKAL